MNYFNSILDNIKSFNIQELVHGKSKHHETKLMHPYYTSRAFQRNQECDLKHPSLLDLITTKQNKQTTFLHKIDVSKTSEAIRLKIIDLNSIEKTTIHYF
jgi:hypothetical protein